MNIIEKYSLSTGLKIKKPEIYTKYFPMPIEKYIYFDSSSHVNYKYWNETLGFIGGILQRNNIDILYINYKNTNSIPINARVIDLSKYKINKNQHAYLIKNSLLYLGHPSFGMNVASIFGKKIVSIFGDTNIQNEFPYWSKKEDLKIVSPNTKIKPYYGSEAGEERINLIRPEEIAYAILDSLQLEYEKSLKTLFIGNNFANRTLEIIPEEEECLERVNINNPIVRMDYSFNENVLEKILEKFSSVILFTNKTINLNLIQKYRNNISNIVYVIEKNHDVNFIKALKKTGIKFSLTSKIDLKNNPDIKLDYMELGLIREIPIRHKPLEVVDKNAYYKTNRILFGKHGKFMTKFDWENNRFSDKLTVPESDSFWDEDLDNLLIYTVDKNI